MVTRPNVGIMLVMNSVADIDQVSERQVRDLARSMFEQLRPKEALNEKLTYAVAQLKRPKFAATRVAFNSAEQRSLLEETIDEDIEAACQELAKLKHRFRGSAPEGQNPKTRRVNALRVVVTSPLGLLVILMFGVGTQ